ncbi:uncharacterized protein, partial [Maniola hyperantus]|uniref:uncharacterized protein n=1 Tax=Aphantopus hyperantus TaxID=2795564 RepID=UPI003749226B
RDSSNHLSLLSNRLHQHKQPLIIVLDKNSAVKNRAQVDQVLSSDTSDEAVYLVHHLLGHDQNKAVQHHVQYKKSTKKPYQRDEKKRQRFIFQGVKGEGRGLQEEDKMVLRSPIVKQLLRMSNSLRCAARNECQEKCNNQGNNHGNYKGNNKGNNKFNIVKEIKCQFQCNAKYDCDEEEERSKEVSEEEKDECENGKDDSCAGSEEMNISTKGIKVEFGQLRS